MTLHMKPTRTEHIYQVFKQVFTQLWKSDHLKTFLSVFIFVKDLPDVPCLGFSRMDTVRRDLRTGRRLCAHVPC